MLSRYLAYRKTLGAAPITIEHLRYRLSRLDPGPMTRRHVNRYMHSLSDLSPATRRCHLFALRGYAHWQLDQHIINRDPTEGFPIPRQPRTPPRALPHDATHRLLHALPDNRARAIVVAMLELGLRIGEVASLRVDDWDRTGRTVRFKGKGGHTRELPVTGPVEAAWDAYLAEHPVRAGEPLIRSYTTGGPVAARWLTTLVTRWMREAGIKRAAYDGVSAHALRHTAASETLDACHDLTVVQELLGHQQLSTTAIYLRRAGLGRLRTAMEARQ